jgi:hypothetical protein
VGRNGVLGAVHAGAPHERLRFWLVAHAGYGSGRDERIAKRRPGQETERATDSGSPGLPGEQPEIVADAADDRSGWRQQQPQSLETSGNVADSDSPAFGLKSGRRIGARGPTDTTRSDATGPKYGWWDVDPDPAHWADEETVLADADSLGLEQGGYDLSEGQPEPDGGLEVSDAEGEGRESWGQSSGSEETSARSSSVTRRLLESRMGRVVDGLAPWLDGPPSLVGGTVECLAVGIPFRTERVKALGNGQVPASKALAWRILK